MAQRERVYEQDLQGPLTKQKRKKVTEAVQRNLGSAVTKQEWHAKEPILTITSQFMTLIISFTDTKVTVEAEYGWTARLLMTEANRKQGREMAAKIAEEAEL